jgi:predicted short-subunit dehydrogenase-like oxidoreductase (DUF2520 family)
MKKAVIIGSGNVAHYFAKLFSDNNIRIIQVYSRNNKTAKTLAKKYKAKHIPDIQLLDPDADLYLLAVSDNYIKETAKCIKRKKGILIHTSGSTPINTLGKKNTAVIYPLQTINYKNLKDIDNVPLLYECNNKDTYKIISPLVKKVSKYTYKCNSKDRFKIHLAAVILNNFTNHLHTMVFKYLKKNKIPVNLFFPLIQKTYKNILTANPSQYQTGPAKRNDSMTIALHLQETYKNDKDLHEIYSLFTTLLFKEYLK